MMLLFTRGSSSSGRFGVGSGPHAQVDPGGMAIVLSRSTSTVSELHPLATSSALHAMARIARRRMFPFLLCGEANGTLFSDDLVELEPLELGVGQAQLARVDVAVVGAQRRAGPAYSPWSLRESGRGRGHGHGAQL